MLKNIRIAFAVVFVLLITALLLDFQHVLPTVFNWLAKIQFIPAVLSGNIIIVVILLLLVFLFGRLYCSCICPFGILQDFNIFLSRKYKLVKKFRYRKPNNVLRYIVLGLVILSLFFGVNYLLIYIEPYSAYGRIANNIFLPVERWINNLLSNVFSANFLFEQGQIVGTAALVTAVITLFVIMFLSLFYGRLYCNTICPVGTFFGLFSRFSIFKVHFDKDKCTGCMACVSKCKSSCIENKNRTSEIDYSRCVACFNCVSACKTHALRYSPSNPFAAIHKSEDSVPENQQSKNTSTNFLNINNNDGMFRKRSRREFFKTATAATLFFTAAAVKSKCQLATLPVIVGDSENPIETNPISPAGSISFSRLHRHCTSCNLCISHCPSHILRPSFKEYGFEGFLQPTLVYKNGCCEYDCVECSSVCPTGAIQPLTVSEKHTIKIGQAKYYAANCIAYSNNIECGSCARHCPTGAITMIPYQETEIPSIDAALCIGCGACEYSCPTKGKAINVHGIPIHQVAKVK